MLKRYDVIERVITSIMAMIMPFIIHSLYPKLETVSQSWETPLQPMFIITNTLVSFFFFKLPKWRVPAILLLLLTAFSVEDYYILHNIFAILFFIFSAVSLCSLHRFKNYLLLYLASICVMPLGLYWVETWAIITLCIYHLHVMIYSLIISRNRPNSL